MRLLPVLLVLFAASGCAALIYEIVWLQLLQLVIGSNAMSIAVLLGTWMGGMCIGSLLLPRLIPTSQNPLRVYALLELLTGVCGILVLYGVPLLQNVYIAGLNSGLPNAALRAICCAICLLPPTILMGATLPLIARWVESTPSAATWWGYFYGSNIVGGVFGCFIAGFYLLRVYDMTIASYVAAATNVIIALASFGILSVAGEYKPTDEKSATAPVANRPWGVYVAIGISGLTALGAEVVWTRMLALMLGATTYTFSIILGVFLAGLGIGSTFGSRTAEKKGNPKLLLIACQVLLGLAIAWAGILLATWLPFWQGNLDTTDGPWMGFLRDIWRCTIPILPPAILWGASFPIALACAAENDADGESGKIVGEVYGANTVGAIIGAVMFSLVMIPSVGMHGAEQALIAISLVGALVLIGLSFKQLDRRILIGFVAAIIFAVTLPSVPWKVIGFGRRILEYNTNDWNLLYTTDGMNSSIAYSTWNNETTYFHVSGKVEASTEPQDMSLQRMLGHLPAILHANPKSILIVGCGAGVTAGSFVVHPEVEHITICEIEPRIPPATAKYFGDANHHVMEDPRTHIVFDDARHYVLTSDQKYDIITSDPIHPWVKGMASLYTTEYFELCKKHLNPGGIVTQWVPLYESSFETVQSEIATFFEAFPYGTIWGNLNTDNTGYDIVLMGSVEKLPINVDALVAKLAQPKYASVRESLTQVGFPSVLNLLSTYAANADDLREWMRTAQINRDRNLRLQYLAGLGLNTNAGPEIFNQIISGRRFPNSIFTGSASNMQPIEQMVGRNFGDNGAVQQQ